MLSQWKITCKLCGKEFTSDLKVRVENDLIVHHQDNHAGFFLDDLNLKAEQVF